MNITIISILLPYFLCRPRERCGAISARHITHNTHRNLCLSQHDARTRSCTATMSTGGSEGEIPVNGDNAPMPHETAGGKADPGLKFLKEIILTAEEEQEYTRSAREGIPGACRGVLEIRRARVPQPYEFRNVFSELLRCVP